MNMVSYRKRGHVWQYEISFKDTSGHYQKIRKSGFRFKSEAVTAASLMQVNNPNLTTYLRGQQSLIDYYKNWIVLYKKNNVSNITYMKYMSSAKHIHELFGETKLVDISKSLYQEKLNVFAMTHAKRTVSGLHKYIRACLLDAIDENIILSDPTRKAVITGRTLSPKPALLNFDEWQKLLSYMTIHANTGEMMILLAAVTGMRYAEIAGLTLSRIDLKNNVLHIDRTWDYKYRTGFKATKTSSSIRKIVIDPQTSQLLSAYIRSKIIHSANTPIFMENNRIMVSAQINRILKHLLMGLDLPLVTFHALRHTHASILLYQGVSVLSVSKRLGHSNITTTQSTYLHIIKELEAKDQNKIIQIIGAARAK